MKCPYQCQWWLTSVYTDIDLLRVSLWFVSKRNIIHWRKVMDVYTYIILYSLCWYIRNAILILYPNYLYLFLCLSPRTYHYVLFSSDLFYVFISYTHVSQMRKQVIRQIFDDCAAQLDPRRGRSSVDKTSWLTARRLPSLAGGESQRRIVCSTTMKRLK